jgi:hypothetical protein
LPIGDLNDPQNSLAASPPLQTFDEDSKPSLDDHSIDDFRRKNGSFGPDRKKSKQQNRQEIQNVT